MPGKRTTTPLITGENDILELILEHWIEEPFELHLQASLLPKKNMRINDNYEVAITFTVVQEDLDLNE